MRAQLDAVLPLFVDGLALDRDVLEQWADFDVEIGLVKERPDVSKAFDFTIGPLKRGARTAVTVRAASDLLSVASGGRRASEPSVGECSARRRRICP